MSQYLMPELPEGFDEPPAFQGSTRPRPGGTPIGTGTGSSSWGSAQEVVTPPQGGGPVLGGGMATPSTSWLPTSMLKRGA